MTHTKLVYYVYASSRDGLVYCMAEPAESCENAAGHLLFDDADECIRYWASHGIEIDRYCF